ncbi:MAG: cation diffusion facilitator family transporter [Bacteroidales bacterium]|nr:cation diffusion facilitator family transporter [Bacteroidales bacterium]
MNHNHHKHNHRHNGEFKSRRLLTVTFLNLTITIAQIIGGLISNSLALISDAMHNLGDTTAILLAYIASKLSKRKANEKNTFGYKRIEILAAFFNALVLISICIFLFIEAYQRFLNPQPVKGLVMLVVAMIGLFGNLASVFLLKNDRSENLNVKAAYLHLLGDTLSSVAVIIGGVFMLMYEIYWIDPLITVIIGVYIIIHTWHVLAETFGILMQGTPPEINLQEIIERLQKIEQVKDIHHVHIWRLNDTSLFFEAHVNTQKDLRISETDEIRSKIEEILNHEFNINHVTLQMEYAGCGSQNGLLMAK